MAREMIRVGYRLR
uniref:Uncharacterized protein n=1 Tax=Arundo donax TaxID=35708 RepID=A0A0A9QCT8_ARUDO